MNSNTQLALYVDDDAENRHPPELDGVFWVRAFNFHQAIYLLDRNPFDIVSLDHDIASFYGNKEMTGWDVLQYLIMNKMDGKRVPSTIYVHSANPVGRKKMQEDIDKYF